MDDLPGMEGVPVPILPSININRNSSVPGPVSMSGRGCPFQCSFCTIINVQGRKSRYRTADDIERILRDNLAQGITNFFITDDNFARNRNWEAIFDRIIQFREEHKAKIKLIIQVDTLCHKIPNFVEKAGRAGVKRVFIGLENINPDNLMAAKKRQNRITEYRKMLQKCAKSVGAVTYCGYILGFPADTPERILRDIEIMQRELPVDLVEFFCLTPLPGSEDHQNLQAKGVWMDPDMNKYDLEHVCTGHPLMSKEEWQDIYHRAWDAFYTTEHVETPDAPCRGQRYEVAQDHAGLPLVLRLPGLGEGASLAGRPVPAQVPQGTAARAFRSKAPSSSIRPIFGASSASTRDSWRSTGVFSRARARVERDPAKHDYMDLALSPSEEQELDELDIFTATESGQSAVDKLRKQSAPRRVKAAAAAE